MKNLDNTQVGDKLVVLYTWGKVVLIVTRTTKTQVHCDSHRFRRDGRELGADRWSRTWARTATAEELAEIRAENRRKQLISEISAACDRISLDKLTTDQLETIHELIVP